MRDNYKPLTREQLNTIYQRINSPDEENCMSDLMRAVEQAAIENYLAQHPTSQDAQVVKDAERFRAWAAGTPLLFQACYRATGSGDQIGRIRAVIDAAKEKE